MAKRAPRIAFLSGCVWNFYQRCTPLCERFAAEGVEIIYIEPLVYSGAHEGHLTAAEPRAIPPGLKVIKSRSRLKRGALFALWQNVYFAWQAWRAHADAVVLNTPQFSVLAALLLRFTRTRVIYDCIDDWPSWSKVPWEARLIERFFNPWTARLSDAVIVTAELLGEDLKPYAKELHWIPNGTPDAPPPDEAIEFGGGKGLLFVGGLAPRIDLDWLTGLARAMSETTLTVIGAGDQYPALLKVAGSLPNLRAKGHLPHEQAMAAMRDAAVCLIPYRPGRLADRCFPIKLPEYWSYGKPVVATPSHELMRIGEGIVQAAASPEVAAAVCRRLLADRDECARLGKLGIAKARGLHYGVLTAPFRAVCLPEEQI